MNKLSYNSQAPGTDIKPESTLKHGTTYDGVTQSQQ